MRLKMTLIAGSMLLVMTPARAETLLTNQGNVIAASGNAVPGMPSTTFGSSMANPAMAEDGTVLFQSNLAGLTITAANSRALFIGKTAADLSVLVQWSDPAPGLPGLTLINNAGTSGIGSGVVRLSPDGRTLWTSRLTNSTKNLPTTTDTAIFGGFPSSMGVIAREGSPAPGTTGAVFSGDFTSLNYQNTGINRNGVVVFQTNLAGGDVVPGTNDVAVYTGTIGNTLSIVVRKGQTMLAGPVTVASFGYDMQIDDNGRILYNVKLAGAGVTTANDDSLWLYTPGVGNTLLVREGAPAPGTAGARFNNYSQLGPNSLNGNGKFEFVTDLVGGDVVAGVNDSALYVGTTGGALTLVGRRGDPAPGTDALFYGFNWANCRVNDAGVVVFQSTLTGGSVIPTNTPGSNNDGIWAGTPGSLSLVARYGDQAPQTRLGSKFGSLAGKNMLNSDFGILFEGDLEGNVVFGGVNDKAWYGWTPVLGTFLVARSGEDLEVAPGLLETVSISGGLQFGNTGGAGLGFSSSGKIAQRVNYSSGVQSVVTVDLNCYPATDYYRDADGDGHGDPKTKISLCAGGVPPPGYITIAGDCSDTNPSSLGASPEVCNAKDDDCNGLIDDGIPLPTGPLTMKLAKSGSSAVISWTPVPGATSYDAIFGTLEELRQYDGYQWLSQALCFANDTTSTSLTAPGGTPSPGSVIWYLMRPMNCDGFGSYDDGAPSQRPGRDYHIVHSQNQYGCYP